MRKSQEIILELALDKGPDRTPPHSRGAYRRAVVNLEGFPHIIE